MFLVVHRRLPEFERRSSLCTRICRIALNLASEYRRRACNRREFLDEAEGDARTEIACPLERQDTLSCVAIALDQLSDEKREVFVLHEIEELSMHDIAHRTRVLLKTAFSRLYGARRELRALLMREGITLGLFPTWLPRRLWLGRVRGWKASHSAWLPGTAAIAACALLLLPQPSGRQVEHSAPRLQPLAASASASQPMAAVTRPSVEAPAKPSPIRYAPRAAAKCTRSAEPPEQRLVAEASLDRPIVHVYQMSAEDTGPPVTLPFGFEWVDATSKF